MYAPEGRREDARRARRRRWTDTFDWKLVGDGDRATIGEADAAFSRTDHPLPTVGVELAHGGKRLVYTADTGPEWSVEAFGPGADLVLSEATYQARRHPRADPPLGAPGRRGGPRGEGAPAMLTHLWPTLDPVASVEEGSEAFGRAVTLAAPHLVTHV